MSKKNLFVDAHHQQQLAYVWQRVALRYTKNPWIGGYDLINEPVCQDHHRPVGADTLKLESETGGFDIRW